MELVVSRLVSWTVKPLCRACGGLRSQRSPSLCLLERLAYRCSNPLRHMEAQSRKASRSIVIHGLKHAAERWAPMSRVVWWSVA